MTREDFKFKDVTDQNAVFYNKAIDVAFNYFESRTCESCKFHKPYRWSDTKHGFICELGYSVLCEGCNKWESK